MNLGQLPKLINKPSKRLGRGLGSGRGKTGGRGTKGQKARGKVKQGFVGGTLPIYKRLPLKRGKGNRQVSQKPLTLGVAVLSAFKKDSVVDLESLVAAKVIKRVPVGGVKILGSVKLEQPITVKLSTSKSAPAAIEEAGGEVVNA